MNWKLNADRPIYVQLLEQLLYKIASGEYSPGDKIPAVRELAAQAAVNPNTMQRALAELEARGLVATHRTAGRTITTDAAVIAQQRSEIARVQGKAYLQTTKSLGFEKNEAIELLNTIDSEG